jgi:hypothetical protein
MKNFKFIVYFLLLLISSCQTKTYLFVNSGQRIGVDFTTGKWLLNELDCPNENKEKLTSEALTFFKENTQERLFYINDVNGLLITRKVHLNPNKVKLKELKDGTGFDFFINITTKKNKNDFSIVELYQDENSTGKNESTVFLEIYDLNLQQIIYSQQVIGTDRKNKETSVWETQKSDKLIDNIVFYKSTNKLMLGSLKKILQDLKNKSIKNQT